MWKNTVEQDRPQMTMWCLRIACWIPKATNRHSLCVMLIAFPLQQRLYKRASTLRFTCVACLGYPQLQSVSIVTVFTARYLDLRCGWCRALHHPHRTHDLRSGSQDNQPSKNSVQKTICCSLIFIGPCIILIVE